jgi:sugar phosphate isomerase/epimerase
MHHWEALTMKKALIGYQIYSAREEAEKDLLGTLEQLAAMGYDGVEFAGFYGHSAEDVCGMIAKTGLTPISSHYPWQAIEKDMYGTISYHLAVGCKYIAIPYLDEATRAGSAGFAKTIQGIYKFGRLAKEAGIQLLYHNHDFEFTKVSDEYGLDFLYDAVPACILKTELDTCWVKYAGEDPAAYIRKYAGRCPIIHLKDYVGRKSDRQPYALIQAEGTATGADQDAAFEFRPVGYGCQDMESIVNAGLESGAEWFIVEQDLSVGRPPLEAAKMSRDTIKKLGL